MIKKFSYKEVDKIIDAFIVIFESIEKLKKNYHSLIQKHKWKKNF